MAQWGPLNSSSSWNAPVHLGQLQTVTEAMLRAEIAMAGFLREEPQGLIPSSVRCLCVHAVRQASSIQTVAADDHELCLAHIAEAAKAGAGIALELHTGQDDKCMRIALHQAITCT